MRYIDCITKVDCHRICKDDRTDKTTSLRKRAHDIRDEEVNFQMISGLLVVTAFMSSSEFEDKDVSSGLVIVLRSER